MAEHARKFRCAIYTRKSTEDGLEQEFNSLDAQYEACRSYILSQRHEGWSLLSDRYDDGGFSGGTLQRPGLQKLLEDVASRKVDIIVIYKVDRLTRSLADFAKIVDVLDGAGASFVSITQSFNTTSSMGRLTLNMLLSFAQFEREVTSERIRDKIAASKRKGIWMGGPVPLGYEVRDRKLVVNEVEAETVRHIMRRYCELDSVRELVAELRHDGVVTKVQNRASGPHKGGIPFRRGALYHLLKNRIYLGQIVHKGSAYPGEHSPIIESDLWDRVQQTLADRAACADARTYARRPSVLAGLLLDGLGRQMVPSHTTKGARSYRYYVTRPTLVTEERAWRISANDVEQLVRSHVASVIGEPIKLAELMPLELDSQQLRQVNERAESISAAINAGPPSACRTYLQDFVHSVTLDRHEVSIRLDKARLAASLDWMPSPAEGYDEIATLKCPVPRVRRGRPSRLLVRGDGDGAVRGSRRDRKLIRLVAEAQTARQLVETESAKPLSKIALEQKCCRTRLGALASVSCLAPDIVVAIIEGRQPAELHRRALLSRSLPFDWNAQRTFLGFTEDAPRRADERA